MPYTMEDFNRDYVIDSLPKLLQEQATKEKLVATVVNEISPSDLFRNISINKIETYLQEASNRLTLIKAIEHRLQERFQIKIEAYYPRLESLSLFNLDQLAKRAETAQTLADFEAHWPDATAD